MEKKNLAGSCWILPVSSPKGLVLSEVRMKGLPSFYIKEVTNPSGRYKIESNQYEFYPPTVEIIFQLHRPQSNFLGRWGNRIFLHTQLQLDTLDRLIRSAFNINPNVKAYKISERISPNKHWGDFVRANEGFTKSFIEEYAKVKFSDEGMVLKGSGEYKSCYKEAKPTNDKDEPCLGWADGMIKGSMPDFNKMSFTIDNVNWRATTTKEEATEVAKRFIAQGLQAVTQKEFDEMLEKIK